MPNSPIIRNKPSGTFLTHFFGGGIDADTRFSVARFVSMSATGEIRPVEAEAETITRADIQRLHPARNEIIICSASSDNKSGCQIWGSIASGLF